MDRNRIVVVTDPATAEGFLMTGVDVVPFADSKDAQEEILKLLKGDTIEILVANDDFLVGMEDWVLQRKKSSTPPILIPLPMIRTRGRVPLPSILNTVFQVRETDAGAREVSGEELEHKIFHHNLEATTCRMCGHHLEPGMRICDRCGSVQRSTRVQGRQETGIKLGTCKMCGAEIKPQKTMCDRCALSHKRRVHSAVPIGSNVLSARVRLYLHGVIEAFRNLVLAIIGRQKKG